MAIWFKVHLPDPTVCISLLDSSVTLRSPFSCTSTGLSKPQQSIVCKTYIYFDQVCLNILNNLLCIPFCCQSLFRWLRSPIFHSDICILIQSCLRVVSQMADSESAAWTLTNENSFLKQLEYGGKFGKLTSLEAQFLKK